MSAEEVAAMDDNEEGSGLGDGSDFGEGEDGDGPAKQDDYQKKEFFARPYENAETEAQVEGMIVKNARSLIRMRVTKPRKEFALEFQTVPKDAADATLDLKPASKTQQGPNKMRKVLEMGLQCGNQIKNLRTQTYFERSVNSSAFYDANDFMAGMQAAIAEDDKLDSKLEKFVDKVAYRIEEALQSNEIINVFQDDFDMLGDKNEAAASETNAGSMTERVYQEQEYSANMRVSCIKFHPSKPDLVAMSLIKDTDFDQRCEDSCKSLSTHVLIVNFKDSHIIVLNYILETPVEITCIEFHPNNTDIVLGGCVNGQVIVWDLRSPEHRIVAGGRKIEVAKMPDEELDKTQQAAVKCKHVALSEIQESHKNFVADIQFIPNGVKVDKKNPTMGKTQHFISISEDGKVCIWDCRDSDKEKIKEREGSGKKFIWKPFIAALQLTRSDGSGDFGLCRILFEKNQTTPTFYAGSDEGDLVQVNWTQTKIKPGQSAEEHKQENQLIRVHYDTERNYRACLALERSPFYDDMLLTVHDYHFCLWKTSLEDMKEPIFRSKYTEGSYNTCGAFSPTRPGVIFITKQDGIDIWDFADQSNKPSQTINLTTAITYFKFQSPSEGAKKGQLMAYGDEMGQLNLREVPVTMRVLQENEEETIKAFWDREIEKCEFVAKRRVEMRSDFETRQKAEDIRKAKEEQMRDTMESARAEREQIEEESYQDDLLTMKAKLGLITEEELENKRKENEKRRKNQ